MAQDISSDLLKQIQDYYARGFGGVPFQDPASGTYYQPLAENGSSGSTSPGLESYGADFNHPGTVAQTYSPDGTNTGSFNWQSDNWQKNLLMALAAAGGIAMLPAAGAAVAGDAGAAGAAGAAGESSVGDAMAAAAASDAGGGSLGGAATGLGGDGAALGGAGGAGGLGGSGAATAAGGGASTVGGSGGLGGLLKGIGGSGLGSLIAPVLGGLLGSQPTTTGTTGTKDIPDWLKPSVFGLLSQTDALRNKQMAPGYLQGYDDMRSVGQGLLNQPIAGNGTSLFPPIYPRK